VAPRDGWEMARPGGSAWACDRWSSGWQDGLLLMMAMASRDFAATRLVSQEQTLRSAEETPFARRAGHFPWPRRFRLQHCPNA